MTHKQNDFSTGNIYKHILDLAIPMTIAQMVQVMYNIVDRIYIGHLSSASTLALTGIGLTFPIITIIMAITNLFAMGGAPLCSIARGKEDDEEAQNIMGNTFSLLFISSIFIIIIAYLTLKPTLFLFGASENSFPYARDYLNIYLIGTPFIVIGTGMNGFINAQGFGKIGMITILAGAITNIILDPIFIFVLNLGIRGAAIATIISQAVSVIWVMGFLLSKKTILKVTKKSLRLNILRIKKIVTLGLAGCLMTLTGGIVQISCNTMLRDFGGDLYVGLMTIVNSVRDVAMLPVYGISNGAQPVLGYNFGAKTYDRIKKGIAFITILMTIYMSITWVLIKIYPSFLIKLFNSDPKMILHGTHALSLYFFGFFMMAFQMVGQTVFVGLGQSKYAIFFTIFRKIIIVVPLTFILPRFLGVDGVFIAEPVSNFLGGIACFSVMLYSLKKFFKE